jgi:hypothetical protein
VGIAATRANVGAQGAIGYAAGEGAHRFVVTREPFEFVEQDTVQRLYRRGNDESLPEWRLAPVWLYS